MKTIILFLLLVLNICPATPQLLVQYRECETCDTHGQNNSSLNYQYGPVLEYEAFKVADDYGVRIDSDKWHGGIDYNSQEDGEPGDGDRGDLIIAIEGGTLGGQIDAGYKRLFVNGTHDFGYGHMFWGSQSNTQSGGCYLKTILQSLDDWAIVIVVDGDTTAIGPDAGKVLFEGDTLEVKNTIEAGESIGPTGGSSNLSELGPHMHLYSNPDGSTSTNDEIPKNPLQYVHYADTTFEVNVLKQNDTEEGITLVYPGTASTTIQVKPKLTGQIISVNRYPKILDANQVEIYLKINNAPNFELIEGPNFESNLCLGGRFSGPERYPRKAYDPGNYNSPWYNSEDQWDRTGIHPYAYRGDGNANPWDDYYYADFVTRIHRDDPMDGTATPTMIADCPQNARYNDGHYELKARVTDVRGGYVEGPWDANGNLAPIEFTLDNFQPFI